MVEYKNLVFETFGRYVSFKPYSMFDVEIDSLD